MATASAMNATTRRFRLSGNLPTATAQATTKQAATKRSHSSASKATTLPCSENMFAPTAAAKFAANRTRRRLQEQRQTPHI